MISAADEKDAIRELMASYCYALDACRFDEVAALFAEHGEWTTGYGSAGGRDEIAQLLEATVPKPGEGPQRKHYITNIIVHLDGDRATATSDYLVVRESETGLLPVMGGRYNDSFVKSAGQWRFARKELEHHIWGDMALKNGH
ncbi:MAG: nuclear transport factor 2 family protein [Hyphomicrobiaceae bacterium]